MMKILVFIRRKVVTLGQIQKKEAHDYYRVKEETA